MDRHVALGTGMDFNRAGSTMKSNFLSGRVTVGLKKQQRARRDKRVSAANCLRPGCEGEFFLSNISVGTIGPNRHVSPHLVGPPHGWEPVATIQVPVPIEKPQEVEVPRLTAIWALGPELNSVDFPQRDVRCNFSGRVGKMHGNGK